MYNTNADQMHLKYFYNFSLRVINFKHVSMQLILFSFAPRLQGGQRLGSYYFADTEAN